MIHIRTTDSNNIATYYWDARKERFGVPISGLNHGFEATHEIIVDKELAAQQLDAVFANLTLT